MKNKEYTSLIKMIEYINKTNKYTEGYSFEQFCSDEKTIDDVKNFFQNYCIDVMFRVIILKVKKFAHKTSLYRCFC